MLTLPTGGVSDRSLENCLFSRSMNTLPSHRHHRHRHRHHRHHRHHPHCHHRHHHRHHPHCHDDKSPFISSLLLDINMFSKYLSEMLLIVTRVISVSTDPALQNTNVNTVGNMNKHKYKCKYKYSRKYEQRQIK